MKKLLLLTLFSQFFYSCGKHESSLTFQDASTQLQVPVSQQVDFDLLKGQILTPHCISCHSEAKTESGIGPWVTAGAPEDSSLYTTVKDGSMPKGMAPLSTADLEIIRGYIEQLTPPTSGTTTGGTTTGGTTTGGTTTGGTTTGGTTTGGTTTGGTTTGGTTTGGTTPTAVTYTEIKTKILSPYRCLNCHSVGTEAKLASWINVSGPDKSKLYTEVNSNSMPTGNPKVPTELKALLLQYVRDFASSH